MELDLQLYNTGVSDAGLAHFKRLTKLKMLGVGPKLISEAGYQDLKRALPDCDIFR